ncbi:MAG TPA: hypothetical protein VFR18_26200 [Terriglobia bacterium]|nr:hypothetical protein [Terriglobia bacterium]
MKRHLLWTFDRGSFQWDILCALILAFLFLIPRHWFDDVPDYMRVSATETLSKTVDRNGVAIFTVTLPEPCFFDTDNTRKKAVRLLEQTLGNPVVESHIQPIRNWTGRVIAYAIWKER